MTSQIVKVLPPRHVKEEPTDLPAVLKLVDYLVKAVPGRPVLIPMPRTRGDFVRGRMFRGHKLLRTLMTDPKVKKLGFVADTEEAAMALANKLLKYSKYLFMRCVKTPDHRSGFPIVQLNLRPDVNDVLSLDEKEGRYVWLHESDSSWQKIKMALIVLLILALCMYQLWPPAVRVVIWYIAVTILLALVGVTVLQLVVYALCWLCGFSVWIVPNLWSDDKPIWELFKPLYSVERAGAGQGLYRITMAVLLVAAGYYVSTQNPDLDTFLSQQKKIVEDLYSGNLLSDSAETAAVSTSSGEHHGGAKNMFAQFGYGAKKRGAPIPKFDELEKMLDEENTEGSAEKAAEGAEGSGEAGSQVSGEENFEEHSGSKHAAPDMDALLDSHEEDEDEGEL